MTAFELLEDLCGHPEISDWGRGVGLIFENGQYQATCVVGEDKPLTKYSDWCEPQDTAMDAMRLAIQNQITGLSEIIRDKSYPIEQRDNCRRLLRALREYLQDVTKENAGIVA